MSKQGNIIHTTFILCALALICTSVYGGGLERFCFKNISITEGLSQSTVYDIVQEPHGRLWIATADGLNLYDSYTFKVYRNDSQNPHSLPDNTVRALHFDGKQTLWVGTTQGLARYNANRACFDNFRPDSTAKCQVMGLAQGPGDTLVVGTTTGLLLFNTQTEKFIPAPTAGQMAITSLNTKDGNILVGTHLGLYLYSPSTARVTPIISELSREHINCIEVIDHQGFWVGTEGAGLFYADDNYRVTHHFSHNNGNLSSNFVRALCMGVNQQLWVGTFNGLDIYNAASSTFDHYHHDNNSPTTISQNSIRTIFMDSQGGMWLGTYFCGLDYYHQLKNRFSLLSQSASTNSLSDRVISCITEDPRTGEMWIGTNDSGLDLYNRRTGHFTNYSRAQIGSANVKCVMPYGSSQTYVGTHEGGMSIINNGSVRNFNKGNSALVSNNIYALLTESTQTGKSILVGTLEGVQGFDPQTNTFSTHPVTLLEPELKSISVLSALSSRTGKIWLGTISGLYCYTPQTASTRASVERYTSKSNPFKLYIQALHEQSNGDLWVGTRTGLYCIDAKTEELTSYTTHNGLPNNVIYGIEQDSFNNLWISTNSGLTSFNITQGTMRTYTQSDGLQSNQFNNYSSCTTADGHMFFGGINGITYFIPQRLQDNPFAPVPIISTLSLFDREILPGDDTGILSEPICSSRKIALRSHQNFFTLHIAAVNFLSAGKNTFSYRLDGLESKWHTTTRGDVAYSNLAPGTYTFMVKAANNDGKWSTDQTQLEIVILPAWYQTLLAKLLFFAICALIIYAAFKFYMAKVEIKRNEEINQMKVRFFINLTHELRTPLTLIIAPLQEILQHGIADKWTRSQLGYIQRSSNRLLQLVNQMLDYRRAELGVFELRVSMISAGTLSQDIFQLFAKTAKNKQIDYEFISDIDTRKYPIDTNYLERILLNLLSNSFKFTPDDGRISLHIFERNDMLCFEISDTGCGIAKSEQKRIFERFYHLYKDHMCSGIGLSLVKLLVEYHHGTISIDSDLGLGATFTIALPRNISAYADKEWNRRDKADSMPDLPLELMEVADTHIPTRPNIQPTKIEGRETVLIVDDDEQIVNYLYSNFEGHYNLLTAFNGQEALTLLHQHSVDLIITDVMMPVMDGLKLCRTVKQNIKTSHILVIMLTAKVNVEDQIGGLRCGADDYLAKPFVLSLLNTKVANLLKIRQRLQSYYAQSMDIEPDKVTFNAMDEKLLQKCMSIVEANLENGNFSIDELSREMGMSRSNLHLKLKAITGESAIDFIRKIKYKHACRMLTERRYTVAEISSMLGFSTPSYFASSFKKYVGCLPTEYVKNSTDRG